MKRQLKGRRGFTLIEMTIVLFIISLLILIIIPNVSDARNHAESVHKNAMVSMVQSQVDNYLDDTDSKKATLESLLDGRYLTTEQYSKAKHEDGISINDQNKVVVSNSGSNK